MPHNWIFCVLRLGHNDGMNWIWLSWLIMSSSVGAFALNCTKINNEIPEMGPLRSQRVTEQDKYLKINVNGKQVSNKIGWCFAYAAADLVSYKLKKRVSAADIAINYDIYAYGQKSGTYNKLLEIKEEGLPDHAIRIMNGPAQGFCSEELIKSDNFQNLGEMDSMFQVFRHTSQAHLQKMPHACTRGEAVAVSMLTKLNFEQISAITSQYSTDRVKKWAELTQKACEGQRIRLPDNTSLLDMDLRHNSRSSMMLTIETELEAGNIALASYNYARLPMKSPFIDWIPKDLRFNAYHASTIVGREIDPETGKCVYKIRNTWGDKCFDVPDSPAQGCKNGYLYVSRDDLEDALTGVTWFKDF